MEIPSLEEVKQKYLEANRVQSINYKEQQFIPNLDTISVFENTIECIDEKGFRRNLYYKGKYAEIISYKEKTYQLSETFVKELCKEPNIKEAFVREGIIEAIVEIPLKDILATPNDSKLGEMVRKLVNEKL
jgi:hypothetical protein